MTRRVRNALVRLEATPDSWETADRCVACDARAVQDVAIAETEDQLRRDVSALRVRIQELEDWGRQLQPSYPEHPAQQELLDAVRRASVSIEYRQSASYGEFERGYIGRSPGEAEEMAKLEITISRRAYEEVARPRRRFAGEMPQRPTEPVVNTDPMRIARAMLKRRG